MFDCTQVWLIEMQEFETEWNRGNIRIVISGRGLPCLVEIYRPRYTDMHREHVDSLRYWEVAAVREKVEAMAEETIRVLKIDLKS